MVGRQSLRDRHPEQVAGFRVTADFFALLGVSARSSAAASSGRGDAGQHRRVVLGHALWTRRFAADPAIVGQTVRFDGEPYEVVGVAPPASPSRLARKSWAPLAYSPSSGANGASVPDRVGRLADGATLGRARPRWARSPIAQRRDHPDTNASCRSRS